MTTENGEKPQYFSNGDFEKTVAGIMSSPRRDTNSSTSNTVYEITPKQKEYYLKCYKHLLKTTQGNVENFETSALNGAQTPVQDFFRKSGLNNETLSKIWALSDVNEDGWLDLNEFSMAMHLIVLRVKGEVPVPVKLPENVRPPLTPARINPTTSTSTLTLEVRTERDLDQPDSARSWENFSFTDNIKAADDGLANFSDTPPLLVDRHPKPVKAIPMNLLSLRSPSGPPPQPPPRPSQKGHGRSASLDLKVQSGFMSLAERRDSDSAAMTSSVCSAPPITLTGKPTPSISLPSVPPPVPQRTTPPAPISQPSVQTVSKAVQTDPVEWIDKATVEKLIAELGGKMDDLLGNEVAISQGNGNDRWGIRCRALRNQNSDLELERARLAQVRKQLEIRLQESQSSITAKPTAL